MSNPELFSDPAELSKNPKEANLPLAARMRPRKLDEIAGQEHLLATGKLLRRTIESDRWTSILLYGPPGSGKTTLAKVISLTTRSHFVTLNAVTSNVAELRKVIEEAKRLAKIGKRTTLFIDEIHRFNKAQQDVLMPDVESGSLVLIGATTHNPSFAIIGPLLSRSTIFELHALEEKDLVLLLNRALDDAERGFGKMKIKTAPGALAHIAKSASGDARRALNALEIAVLTTPPVSDETILLDEKAAEESCQRRIVYYDPDEDYHYDTISVFIKSMRGSNPDAAVYWLAKMLYAGEDPRFIMRRILIFASEDIGNADPQALILAAAGMQAIEFVGMPEAQLILSQLVTYMASAPKSNAATLAISEASADVQNETAKEVPAAFRDAHYKGAKKLGRGEGYQYSHDLPGPDTQIFLPGSKDYYRPKDSGFESHLAARLKELRAARKESSEPS